MEIQPFSTGIHNECRAHRVLVRGKCGRGARRKDGVRSSSPAQSKHRGAGLLGGIGFTMSIFIASLAFAGPARLAEAKLAILAASLVAGAAGWALLRAGSPGARLSPPPAA